MKLNHLVRTGIIISVAAFFYAGCKEYHPAESVQTAPRISKAVCVLHPTRGNDVTGIITFTKADSGIHVVADIYGLTPGKHGFHIHEYGDCSAPDGTSSGGHFNPDGNPHAGPNDSIRHAGDMGNVTADSTGTAHYELTDNMLAFSGKYSVIGRAVIVHAGEDDLVSQPTGNAGARVACGVIGISME